MKMFEIATRGRGLGYGFTPPAGCEESIPKMAAGHFPAK